MTAAALAALAFGAAAAVRAQACCGRMDLPLAAAQRAGSRAGELVGSAAYEYALSDDGLETELLRVDYVHGHRLALDVGYGVTPWLTPNLTLPLGAKLIEERIGRSDETRSTFGLGDAMLLAKLTVVGAEALAPGKLRLWLAPGVKLPTGEYRAGDEFGRIPPPAQLGTGSLDALAGAFASIGLTGEGSELLLLAHVLARLTTANPERYRFGHALDASVLVQLPLSEAFAARAGPALAFAARDDAAGADGTVVEVSNSGGTTLSARAALAFALAERSSLALDLELPLLRAVHGDQLDPVLRAGLGLLFALEP